MPLLHFSFSGLRDLLERELTGLEAFPLAKINGPRGRIRDVCKHFAVLVSSGNLEVMLEGCVSFLVGDNCHSGCWTLDWPLGGLGVAAIGCGNVISG